LLKDHQSYRTTEQQQIHLFHKQDVTDLSESQLVSLKSTSDEQMVVVMNK
jgi:hypothetical protein